MTKSGEKISPSDPKSRFSESRIKIIIRNCHLTDTSESGVEFHRDFKFASGGSIWVSRVTVKGVFRETFVTRRGIIRN